MLALPVGLLCIPLALVGGPAAHIQRGLARRLLGLDTGAPARTGLLALAHALVSAPLNAVAAVVALFFWMVVVINIGYPLRPDNDYAQSWGGPTLAGAWAVHGIAGGLGFLLLTPWVVKGFNKLQTRLIAGFLGADRTGLLRTAGLALAVAAVCVPLSIPVIHQF